MTSANYNHWPTIESRGGSEETQHRMRVGTRPLGAAANPPQGRFSCRRFIAQCVVGINLTHSTLVPNLAPVPHIPNYTLADIAAGGSNCRILVQWMSALVGTAAAQIA